MKKNYFLYLNIGKFNSKIFKIDKYYKIISKSIIKYCFVNNYIF